MGLIIAAFGALFYLDLGFVDLVPLFPLYITVILLINTVGIPYNLIAALTMVWLLGISTGSLGLSLISAIIVVPAFLLFNTRYRTRITACLIALLLSGTAILFTGASYGAIVAPVITFFIVWRMDFEDK